MITVPELAAEALGSFLTTHISNYRVARVRRHEAAEAPHIDRAAEPTNSENITVT